MGDIGAWAVAVSFAVVACLSLRLMIIRPASLTRWAALAFCCIGVVSVASLIAGQQVRGGFAWESFTKVLVVVLAVFPWAMLRMALSVTQTKHKVVCVVSDVWAMLLILVSLFINFATLRTGNPVIRNAYSFSFLGYMIIALLLAGCFLWLAGRNQPYVVRDRLRMLAAGTYILSISLLLSFTRLGGTGPSAERTAQRFLTVVCAVLFLIPLATPLWFRRLLSASSNRLLVDCVRMITSGEAVSQPELLLTPMAALCGSDTAALLAPDGRVVETTGCEPSEFHAITNANKNKNKNAMPITLSFSRGTFVICLSDLWPFHDGSIEGTVGSIAAILDVGIARQQADEQRHELETKRSIEESRLAQAAELERVNGELNQFVAVASHDLQAPIRNIRDFVDLLRRDLGDKLTDNVAEDLLHIASGTSKMQELLDALLSYTRISNETESTFEPVPLAEVVDASERVLANTLRKADATVKIVGDLPVIDGDPATLIELFTNLLENSVKYAAADRAPVVTISTRTDSHNHIIRLSDNGEGIPELFRERVFSMFTRLHAEDEIAGSGIGLAVCRKIVERHSGVIWIEGAVDDKGAPTHGTVVAFTFPVSVRRRSTPISNIREHQKLSAH